ncbi:MAG: T9SS type A sorting domain-containing protein [Porphyromonas sp.]|uniref:InlB B-repeat-containing protein n=1 Tax=Porphyromonas sp. TaxID=1924944 RepID=UPI002A7569C3|nr:T9SS type A sorting domain-containing protein [Porphyromonas sp.]MDD6929151.1 T9SS type A sorting domain-containing protein [Bacteroidales bacterium]MDY3111674.1 T9SS type A sorting domain-containing protein [Porphyromonas sp.]
MNHRLLIAALLALLGMAIHAPLSAQEAAGENVITLKLTELPTNDDDDPMPLSLTIQGEGEITLEGLSEAYAADRTSYTPTRLEIKIHGAVTSMKCEYVSVLSAIDITSSKTIEKLSVKNSSLTDLQAKNVSSLKELSCAYSSLPALDLTGCTGLKTLAGNANMKLQRVVLAGCTALENVELQNSGVSDLDITGLVNLKHLNVARNPVKELNLKGMSQLTTLDCKQAEVTALDLSDCVALEDLTASSCLKLATVKLPKSDKLQYIYLQESQIEEIDLSGHAGLVQVYLERCKKLTKVSAANCPNLKLLSLHLCALPAETTLALVEDLADHGADYNAMSPAYKIFALGTKVTYQEGNVWTPKAASVARRKGWALFSKNENEYAEPTAIFEYAKVTIEETAHGQIAIKGYDKEDWPYMPQGETYKVVATPEAGYELKELKVNDDDILEDLEFQLFGDSKITATFAKAAPVTYEYYLTKVEPTVATATVYTYGYDENKKWVSRTAMKSDGTIESRHDIRYDGEGRISDIDITLAYDYAKDGKPSMFTHYTYDDQGRIVRRQMKLFTSDMADIKIGYRPDGQIDYWAEQKAKVMNNYIYNDKNQLVEEQFGEATDLDSNHPTVSTPTGKMFYSYNDKGQKAEVKYATVQAKWLYIKGEQYTWDEQGLMSSVKAMNYTYDQGETDPEKGKPNPVFELRYQYDEKAKTKVFWPMLPITEENGGFAEFSYDLKGYCKKAEHWLLSNGDPKHTFDFIYVFEASPRHLQKLVDKGTTTVQYTHGTITAEGAALEGLQVYDTTGQLLRDYHTAPCQRIDMGVSELPDGLYIVRTISSDSTQTDKVVITQ